jgi:hypothetical protein
MTKLARFALKKSFHDVCQSSSASSPLSDNSLLSSCNASTNTLMSDGRGFAGNADADADDDLVAMS